MTGPLEIRVGLEGGGFDVEAVARRTAELMRERMVPELARASPRRTKRLSKGWNAVAGEDHVLIVNSQFYVAFQKREVDRKFNKIIRQHAFETVAQAVREVGLPAIRDQVADALQRAARRSGGALRYRR